MQSRGERWYCYGCQMDDCYPCPEAEDEEQERTSDAEVWRASLEALAQSISNQA